MVKNILQSINDVQVYAIIGLIIFMAIFLYIVYRTIRMKKDDLNRYSRLPLEDSLVADHLATDDGSINSDREENHG